MRSSPPLVRTLPESAPTRYPSAWDKWIVLPITLGVMAAQPLALLYMLALGHTAIVAPADMLVVVLLVVGATWLTLLVDGCLATIRRSGDTLSGVSLYIVGWIIFLVAFEVLNPPLFGTVGGPGAQPEGPVPSEFAFLNFILITVAFWLGSGFARELGATTHGEHRFLLTMFRAGIAVVAGAIICAIAAGIPAILAFLPLSLPLFVLSGGVSVALGNIITSRLGQSQPEGAAAAGWPAAAGWSGPGDNPWHGFLDGIGFAAVVVMLLLETVAGPLVL